VAAQIVGGASPTEKRPLAQVALAWVLAQPGITAPIVGASKLDQLHDNLDALDIHLTPAQLQILDDSSALEPAFPYNIFTSEVNRSIFGGTTVRGW
jgi:aryl-alcohol dehydrogenase-like predicted oxidoreductase